MPKCANCPVRGPCLEDANLCRRVAVDPAWAQPIARHSGGAVDPAWRWEGLPPPGERLPVGRWPFVLRCELLAAWSGYGRLALNVGRELVAMGADVRFHADSVDESKVPLPEWARARLGRPSVACPTVSLGTPWYRPDGDEAGIQWSMWEADRIPAVDAENLRRRRAIITPTRWGRRVLKDSGVDAPCAIVPLGVDPALFPMAAPLDDHVRFVVLAGGRVAHGGVRKGHSAVAHAFLRAFPGDDSVRMRVKVWPDCLNDPRLGVPDDRRIILDPRPLTEDEMARWYTRGHLYATASRGEGWGLMTHEAMVAGLPVAGAAWGAAATLLSDATGYPVDYRLTPTEPGVPYQGVGSWAEVDIDALADAMRAAYDDRDRLRVLAAEARRRALSLSWRNAATRLVDALVRLAEVPPGWLDREAPLPDCPDRGEVDPGSACGCWRGCGAGLGSRGGGSLASASDCLRCPGSLDK